MRGLVNEGVFEEAKAGRDTDHAAAEGVLEEGGGIKLAQETRRQSKGGFENKQVKRFRKRPLSSIWHDRKAQVASLFFPMCV